MKRSSKYLIASVAIGTAAAGALALWVPFVTGWGAVIVGVILTALLYSGMLRGGADTAITDSKTVNR